MLSFRIPSSLFLFCFAKALRLAPSSRVLRILETSTEDDCLVLVNQNLVLYMLLHSV